MDLSILDAQLKRTSFIETFDSFIWTERYSVFGDFELHIKSNAENRFRITEGTWLSLSTSQRVMVIESVEKNADDSGFEMMTVKGRSIEGILDERAAVFSMVSTQTDKYYISAIPGDVARTLVQRICVTGAVDSRDIIPMLVSPTFVRDPREPTTSTSWLVEPDTLYNALIKLCGVNELGFKLVRPSDAAVLQFYIYAGLNRTSNQLVNNQVIFAKDFDNIQHTKSLSSTQLVRNVAYVTSSALNKVIYASEVDPNVAGFQRRIVVIDLGDKGEPPALAEPDYGTAGPYPPEPDYGYANIPLEPDYGAPPEGMTGYDLWKANRDSMRATWEAQRDQAIADWTAQKATTRTAWFNQIADINGAWNAQKQAAQTAWQNENTSLYNAWLAEINLEMDQKAAEEFKKYQKVSTFDGEINERSALRYGIDYDLGDLVELRNEDGFTFTRRVTEQIFVSDKEGERSYPTLSEAIRTT